jgi:putative SOS response-associated peptidase YedK
MCGLYSFRKAPEETRNLFNYLETPDFPPRRYVTPGGPIAIVTQNAEGRHYLLVRWGLVPSWVKDIKPGKPLINARSETILEKPSFRNAMKRRRCLIPADGFYEWEGDVPGQKRPYFIRKPDEGIFAFAGIWEHWQGADGSELESACMITGAPNAEVSRIHTRSPVIIHPQDFEQWLDCANVGEKEAAELLVPPPDGYFVLEQTRIERASPPKKAPKPEPKKSGQPKLF